MGWMQRAALGRWIWGAFGGVEGFAVGGRSEGGMEEVLRCWYGRGDGVG